MKIDNNILYPIIISYAILILFNFNLVILTVIALLLLVICIGINLLYIKPLKNIEINNEHTTFLPVSIIIPAWNEESIIKKTIESVLMSSYPNFKIIVVAGGSDKTYEHANHFTKVDPRVTVVKQDPLGKSAALNVGLKYVMSEIVVFLDADCIVDINWLKNLVTPIINKEVNITIGNFQPFVISWVSLWYYMNNIFLKLINNKKNFFGGSIAFERTIFNKIKEFDEKIYGDDYFLSTHLEKDYKIKFVEKSLVRTDIPFKFIQYIHVETRWLRILLHTTFNFNKRVIKVFFSFFTNIIFILGLPVLLFFYYYNMIPFLFIKAWAGYFFFIILLNVSKPLYVYKITKNNIWIKYIWIAIFFPIIDYLLGLYAILTYYKKTPFFKGPRKL